MKKILNFIQNSLLNLKIMKNEEIVKGSLF